MVNFRTSSGSNTEAVNKVVAGFHNSMQAEKEALFIIHSEIKVDNVELKTSVLTKIKKLQEDFAIENMIMAWLEKKT